MSRFRRYSRDEDPAAAAADDRVRRVAVVLGPDGLPKDGPASWLDIGPGGVIVRKTAPEVEVVVEPGTAVVPVSAPVAEVVEVQPVEVEAVDTAPRPPRVDVRVTGTVDVRWRSRS
ncbi:MAG: hypothetical protein ACRDY1_05865 [Acidimicrobiales bacterium]